MRRARLSRLAVIVVCGAVCWLAYATGLHLQWEALLQTLLLSAHGPTARTIAVAALIIAALVVAIADTNGGVRRLSQIAFGVCLAFVRWLIGDVLGASGRQEGRVHPTDQAAQDHGARNVAEPAPGNYHLELNATPAAGTVKASWSHAASSGGVTDERLPVERLSFGYEISGDWPRWRPPRVFDDGENVYIHFPGDTAPTERPSLFLVQPRGLRQPVDYRMQGAFGVASGLFDSAELRSRGRHRSTVRIVRKPASH